MRITQPVLSVRKRSNAVGAVQPGQTITYTVVISNAGDADATGVQLSDALPANTTGADFAMRAITVAANSEVAFTYGVIVNASLISGTQIVTRRC